MEKNIPCRRLEDAQVPLHVLTTELKTGRAFALSSGLAIPALLASLAIPGVFPPVTIGERILVDGGIARDTPIATAIEISASRIYVLPVSYTWLNHEPSNALGMALHAVARFVDLPGPLERFDSGVNFLGQVLDCVLDRSVKAFQQRSLAAPLVDHPAHADGKGRQP